MRILIGRGSGDKITTAKEFDSFTLPNIEQYESDPLVGSSLLVEVEDADGQPSWGRTICTTTEEIPDLLAAYRGKCGTVMTSFDEGGELL